MSESKSISAEVSAQGTRAVVDTVRQTVFPGASDPELMVFFHKCNTLGVHPLGGMVHPMKFNTENGSKVTFIVSIDLLRSRSAETGQYDGMDEAEYTGEYEQETDDGVIVVPEMARVKVYRKDVSRPFVGVARWKEFYPGQKKGHQWRGKPYLMLSKCAEAQARRLAFPQELDKLYTAEELDATTAMLAGIPDNTPKSSTKPRVSPDSVVEAPPGFQAGIVQDVSTKTGSNDKGPWTKYGIKIGGVFYSTFSEAHGQLAVSLKGKNVFFSSEKKGNYHNLVSIKAAQEPAPDFFAGVTFLDADEFVATVSTKCYSLGISLPDILKRFGVASLAEVPADKQSAVLDYVDNLEQAGNM